LEAVCHKAMAAEPAGRYVSARALGEEVERWLAGEPVEAYPEPLLDRARRWGRRHRTLVTSGLVLLLASVVGLSLGRWTVRVQRDGPLLAERQAKENLELAERNLDLAHAAVDGCYGLADSHPFFQEPGARKVKKLLLEKTLPFYKEFRAQRDDPKLA